MIEARGLTKRYGDALGVDDLSFVVRPGVARAALGSARYLTAVGLLGLGLAAWLLRRRDV